MDSINQLIEYMNDFVLLSKEEMESLSDEQRSLYQEKEKIYKDNKHFVDFAQEQSKEKTKFGNDISREIAKNFLLDDLSVEMVAKNTKLSSEEVQQIADSLIE
ncbi:hypothetical protein [Bernardetia sp. MNP-M8]|uniref:hypothetical protein n=1 Tax=Bernardetia sp. MNP-M8 TaxID=3127470 RepID=UPI0030D109EF